MCGARACDFSCEASPSSQPRQCPLRCVALWVCARAFISTIERYSSTTLVAFFLKVASSRPPAPACECACERVHACVFRVNLGVCLPLRTSVCPSYRCMCARAGVCVCAPAGLALAAFAGGGAAAAATDGAEAEDEEGEKAGAAAASDAEGDLESFFDFFSFFSLSFFLSGCVCVCYVWVDARTCVCVYVWVGVHMRTCLDTQMCACMHTHECESVLALPNTKHQTTKRWLLQTKNQRMKQKIKTTTHRPSSSSPSCR